MTQEIQPQPDQIIEAARSLMAKEAELEPTLETLQGALGVRIELQLIFLEQAFSNLTAEKRIQLGRIAQRYLKTCIDGVRPPREEEKEYHTLLYEGVNPTLTEYFEFYWRLAPRCQDQIPNLWQDYFQRGWNYTDAQRMAELDWTVQTNNLDIARQNLQARSQRSTIRQMGKL